jgi:transposase
MAQRRYDKEFKINAVNLYKNGKRASEISRDLGVPEGTFYYWVEQYGKEGENSFRGSGTPKASNEEVVRLRKELETVKMERDILKKAVAIFSKQKQ